MQIPVLAIVGPTASGKTDLSVELCLRHGGEVISADSMQIYTGMNIAAAVPSMEERKGVPHHLMEFLSPEQSFNVADYVRLASEAILDVHNRGKLPVVTGGTGLYVDSLLNGMRFEDMPESSELRAELMACAEEKGPDENWQRLHSLDPEAAAAIHPRNISRVVRALEVCLLTGETFTERSRRAASQPSPYRVCRIGLDFADRENLYRRIRLRVDRMVGQGLVEECRSFMERNLSDTSAQAIGCKELAPYFAGLSSLEDCLENLKKVTCHYAKRQQTWFRRNRDTHWLMRDQLSDREILENAEKTIAFPMNL